MATACTAYLYKRQTKAVESAAASAQARMGESADEAFANIRTVRIFAGEALAREGFTVAAADSRKAGLGFAKAKATLEGLNRGAIHVSLLALYALGGEPAAPPLAAAPPGPWVLPDAAMCCAALIWANQTARQPWPTANSVASALSSAGYLVSQNLMPVRTLLSAIGFTFSLVFATQGTLQSFTDARQMLAAVRRVQATLRELPPDPRMSESLAPGVRAAGRAPPPTGRPHDGRHPATLGQARGSGGLPARRRCLVGAGRRCRRACQGPAAPREQRRRRRCPDAGPGAAWHHVCRPGAPHAAGAAGPLAQDPRGQGHRAGRQVSPPAAAPPQAWYCEPGLVFAGAHGPAGPDGSAARPPRRCAGRGRASRRWRR